MLYFLSKTQNLALYVLKFRPCHRYIHRSRNPMQHPQPKQRPKQRPQLPAKSAVNCAVVFCFLASFFSFTSAGRGESQPQAKVVRIKGAVQIAGKSVAEGGTVKPGQTIVSGADGTALLALTAGQYLFVNKATTVSVSELKYLPTGPERSTVVQLEKGALFSQVRQPRQGTTAHKVITPFGELSAKGTAWSTKVGDTLTVVVYSGTVGYTFPGIGDVSLPPGSVATLTGAPGNPVLKVVNLVTGRIPIYQPGQQAEDKQPGQQPENKLADAKDLAAAARTFEEGVNAFLATATDAAQVALALLIGQINQMLASHGVAPISNRGGPLFPRALTAGMTGLADIASPESANLKP